MTAETDEQFLDGAEYAYGHHMVPQHRARLFALARRGAAAQWRPIEEAPKDGAFVLLFNAASEAWCPTIARWNGDGWGDEGSTFHIPGLNMPTHWMTLPPPPAGETNEL